MKINSNDLYILKEMLDIAPKKRSPRQQGDLLYVLSKIEKLIKEERDRGVKDG